MIDTLIFDWGGVLTIGKYTPSILKVISKEKSISTDEHYLEIDKLVVRMNEGVLSFTDFVKQSNSVFRTNISEREMREIFKKAIIRNEEMEELLVKLSKKYNLVMLSDNDTATVENLQKHHSKILGLFSKTYFSNELKMRKPNHAIFKYVIKDLRLNPAKCVFIDDKQKNVDAAKECGLNGIVFTSVDELQKELAKFNVKH